MGMECTSGRTEINMRGSGRLVSDMEMELISSQMETVMLDNISMGNQTDLGSTSGLMEINIQVSSKMG